MSDKKPMFFAALRPYVERNIILPTETELRGQKFVEFGDKNQYPNYLWSLYNSVSTLQSIINGTVDYVVGDEVISKIPTLTDRDAKKLVTDIAQDLLIYGGTYIQVLRNAFGDVAKVDTVDFRNIRTDKKNEFFYYSEDFSNGKSYGRCKMHIYPAFNDEPVSIYYSKNNKHQVYPIPVWGSAVTAAEIENNINQYHLNNLENGFAPTAVVSFNNGVPTDDIRREIEEAFDEKYTGYENGGRVLINFADDKDHSVDISTIDVPEYGERYKALAERSQEQLFIAFRASKNLFGGVFDGIGFNTQEYDASFKLYNKTVVQPLQKKIIDMISEIYGVEDCIEIKPFTITFE